MSQLAQGQSWQPDVLGRGYQALRLMLNDEERAGEKTPATIIRAPQPSQWSSRFGLTARTDVLFVHGWSDYFFQTHVADFWRERGARFFALDLRRYGRNLSNGAAADALPGYVASLDTYDEEIEAALEVMGHGPASTPSRRLVLMGHSTGGLILSLWASRNPNRASSLVLNSPWLELQTREIGRLALAPFIDTVGKYQPKKPFPAAEPGFYMRTLAQQFGGEWDINLEWHPERSFPIYPGWLKAITQGHQRVAAGLNLNIPICVLLAERSLLAPVWSEEMKQADVVLDVVGVARRSLNLGATVTIARCPGAMHDVFLSAPPARAYAFAALEHWLSGYARSDTRTE